VTGNPVAGTAREERDLAGVTGRRREGGTAARAAVRTARAVRHGMADPWDCRDLRDRQERRGLVEMIGRRVRDRGDLVRDHRNTGLGPGGAEVVTGRRAVTPKGMGATWRAGPEAGRRILPKPLDSARLPGGPFRSPGPMEPILLPEINGTSGGIRRIGWTPDPGVTGEMNGVGRIGRDAASRGDGNRR
jgi:hypothetical protein